MQKEKLQKGKQNPTSHIALHTSQKGITLIALIITIIVMLILVGVSVTVALNGGLFTSAKDAVDKTQIEAERESLLEAMMGAIGNSGKVELDKLSNNLPKEFEEVEEERTETTRTYRNTKTGNKYTVSINREINQVVAEVGGTGNGGTGNDGTGSEEEVQTGTALTNTANAIQIGDLVYVGDATTKTATVYGTRGDIDYTNSSYLGESVLVLASEQISIASKVKINEEEYTVTEIGYCAFVDSGITQIKIPNSVTSIGDYALSVCEGLTEITIPNSVINIGLCAFGYSSALQIITIGENVQNIGEWAFAGTGLTEIIIPNSVISIGEWAFSGTGLTEITIPSSVTSIGGNTFNLCESLTQITVYWPEGVKPEGWNTDWNFSSAKVVDGFTGLEYN